MSATTHGAELTPIKRALLELRELRARVAELEAREHEPVAIVGMSVRAPGGVTSVAEYAEMLWAGRDAITEIPGDRWPLGDWFDESQDAAGKMYTRHGGFIEDVKSFDAEFFGIAPVEAASMDPQQRLVLELAWEALEYAGHAPSSLAGSRTGVYLGIANGDYGRALFARPDLIDPYLSPGNAYSVAAGRVAYVLGLNGPAIAIDTACSSSLVALHLACQALRQRDCDLALVGGVNLILSPEMNVNFSKAGMMARDGRCRTFDAEAAGYVRGEGGGMVVVRRLREALAAGDRILAIVRGSAINQDGRSNGLTAPNGPAQQAVVRAALDAAGIAPALVGYVEAHGTGTSLGDPIEVGALAGVLSEGREASSPLVLGSVKTNIGHLEAAAGIAGLIKTVIALERHEIPAHLHLKTPNPFIDWTALPITIPNTTIPWEAIDDRRIAGVSSFGFSGTNAHVILEDAPASVPDDAKGAARPEQLLPLSARDPQALREVVQRYCDLLTAWPEGRDASPRDICCTAAVGRTHFAHRLSVTGATVSALAEGLDSWLHGKDDPRVVHGCREAQSVPPRVAFLFPGQGKQYAGMGRQLYNTAPVFRLAFEECAALLEPLLGRPITPMIYPEDHDESLIDHTAFAQPAMFAVEYALARLWRSWGVEPAAVMGHSFGEYAAACVAGVLSLGDAARMVVARGRLTAAAPGDGLMMIVEASAGETDAAIQATGEAVAIAAINGASNTVISGDRTAVHAVAAVFEARGLRTTLLRVSHAFHSPLMDPILDEFERELAPVKYSPPATAIVSSLTGGVAGLETLGRARYWREHLRQPVRFAEAMRAVAGLGITHYLEMSPHPVLLGMGAECVTGGTWLPSLRQDQNAWSEMLRSLQSLYADGLAIDWSGLEGGTPFRRVPLPTYPFQRRRHWVDVVRTTPEHGDPGPVDLWSAVTRGLDREALRGPLDLNAASYPAKWDCLERLTDAQISHALMSLGAFGHTGDRHTLDSVLSATGISPTHRRLASRWLDRLTAAGVLRRDGDEYVATGIHLAPLEALWVEAEGLFSDNPELFAYVRHCAASLSPIVTGARSALESLFPDGSFDLAIALYERSATMRYVNGLAAAALAAVHQALPWGRDLRVLEVGAGTGGTTSAVLSALPADRTRYRFTDVSDAFLDAARSRFAAYPQLEFDRFDLDADFADQGYEAGSFDLIVSANAVHAVRDLRSALNRLRALLAPGGLLVLIESTAHLAHFDMTTGLIEGWQHFEDDLRGDNPLLAPESWLEALRAAGMVEARAWPERGSLTDTLGQHLIVAAAPGRVSATAARAASSFASLLPAVAAGAHAQDDVVRAGTDVRQRVESALPSERISVLIDVVRREVMRILRLDESSAPSRHDRLMDLGMDSLMAVQLRNALVQVLGLERRLPATLMFDYPTIEALAGRLLQGMQFPGDAPVVQSSAAPAPPEGPVRLGATAVAEMSEQEIEALLMQRLDKP